LPKTQKKRDFSCENLQVNKKLKYARAGVKELWVIDPEPRVLTIPQLTSDGVERIWQLGEEDNLFTNLLPGFNLAVEAIFER
jgi:Uma2 family endonuclease